MSFIHTKWEAVVGEHTDDENPLLQSGETAPDPMDILIAVETMSEIKAMSKTQQKKTVAALTKRPSERKGKTKSNPKSTTTTTQESNTMTNETNSKLIARTYSPIDAFIETMEFMGVRERAYATRSLMTSINMSIIGQANLAVNADKRKLRTEGGGVDKFNEAISAAEEAAGEKRAMDDMGLTPAHDRKLTVAQLNGLKEYVLETVKLGDALSAAIDSVSDAFNFMTNRRSDQDSNEIRLAMLSEATGMNVDDIRKATTQQFDRDRLTMLQNKADIFDLIETSSEYSDFADLHVTVQIKVTQAVQRALRNQANVAIQQVMRGSLDKVGDITLIKKAQEKIQAFVEDMAKVNSEFALALVA